MFKCFLLSFVLRKNNPRSDRGEKKRDAVGHIPLEISGSILPPE
jgi:hypothetical protein